MEEDEGMQPIAIGAGLGLGLVVLSVLAGRGMQRRPPGPPLLGGDWASLSQGMAPSELGTETADKLKALSVVTGALAEASNPEEVASIMQCASR